jgi:P4 family phage/plasmid primase-like protien
MQYDKTPHDFLSKFPNTIIRYFDEAKKGAPITPTEYNPQNVPPTYGAYFSVNGFKDNSKEKKNITNINALHLDLDKVNGVKLAKEDVLATFFEKNAEPSILVETKNGYHGYWLLEEPQQVTDINREALINLVEGMNYTIAETIGTDTSTADVSRVLRIPGSMHRKNVNDQFLIRIVLESDMRYTLDELRTLFPPAQRALQKRKTSITEAVGVKIGERHAHLRGIAMSFASRNEDPKVALATLRYVNSTFEEPKEDAEVHMLWKTAYDKVASEGRHTIPPRQNTDNTEDTASKWKKVQASLEALRNDYNHAEEAERKQLKRLVDAQEKALLAVYHHKLADTYQHLLYEEGEDSTYWLYNENDGVYKSVNAVSVRSLVMALIEKDGITPVTATVRECLARYRATYPQRGKQYADFDSEENMFHVHNGWIDIRTREFKPHTPEILSTNKASVKYDPDAECPTYNRIFNDWEFTSDLIRAIDQFSGNILRTDVVPARMLVLEGIAGTGKSTLANIWAHIMGDLAVREYSLDSFANNPRFCKGAFVGKRLAWFNEANPKRTELGTEIHKMVDGHTFIVERKGVSEITEHKNMCSCILTCNELPDNISDGTESRIIYIKYTKQFRGIPELEDPGLHKKLKEEASGILNRMLRGLEDYEEAGAYQKISQQDEIMEDHKRTASLPIEFLDVHFDPSPDMAGETFISNTDFRNAFDAYAKNKQGYFNSPERISKEILKKAPRRFGDTLQAKKMTGGIRGLVGLKLKPAYRWGEGLESNLILPNKKKDYSNDYSNINF